MTERKLIKLLIFWIFSLLAGGSKVRVNCFKQAANKQEGNRSLTVLAEKTGYEVFHVRRKRFLVFDKGSTIVLIKYYKCFYIRFKFQGNIAKAIISLMPRGLNEIAEYSLTYDLPTGVDIFDISAKRKPTKSTKPPIKWTTSSNLAQHDQYLHEHIDVEPFTSQFPGDFPKSPYISEKVWCPKVNAYKILNPMKHREVIDWCKNTRSYHKRRGRAFGLQADAESIFFDLVAHWAKMHGYNPRYCFMRALCESQHLLMPQGYSLFHDLLHILIDYSLPLVFRHPAMQHSFGRMDFNDCANLYGAHCRLSLLYHFTNAVHRSYA